MNNKKFVFIVLFLSFLLTLLHYIYRLGIIDKIKSKQDLIAFDEGTVDIIKPQNDSEKEIHSGHIS